MATRTITSANTTLTSALSGSLSAGDTVYINKFAIDFTNADLSATDLLNVTLTAGFAGTFKAEANGQLKLVVNQTSTGVVINQSASPRIDLVSTSSTGVIYEIRNQPAVGGLLTLSTLKCTNFYQVDRGNARIAADVDLTNAYISAGRVEFVEGNSFTTTLITVGDDAAVTLNRDVTTLNVEGDCQVTINSSYCTPTTINLRGGTLYVAECGTIAALNGTSGTADFSRVTIPTTVTARACGPGVEIILPKSGLVTFSGTSGDFGGGPSIRYV
jgi:hypothetical protein